MQNNKRNIFYFGLEPLKERYTYQLSEVWMPETFKDKDVNFIPLMPDYDSKKIETGFVLDATGRGIYSMMQCQILLNYIRLGHVQNDDILFLQDFWTPGIESVLYALHLQGIKVKIYSMLHAQSVDEYDFTHGMKDWMRGFELGLDAAHAGIFVGSTIHKEQLRQAGFKSPIHVVGLPIHIEHVSKVKFAAKENTVIFTSRFDKEKNPFFLLKVAESFLKANPDWKFVVTTSADVLRSSIPSVQDAFNTLARKERRFVIKTDLTKSEYYDELNKAKIQFNCSLQDYVSWTLLESNFFGCIPVYPNFRSFPEILDSKFLYKAFDIDEAVMMLDYYARANSSLLVDFKPVELSDLGRQFEAHIMLNDIEQEFNIWHESQYIKHLLNENSRSR